MPPPAPAESGDDLDELLDIPARSSSDRRRRRGTRAESVQRWEGPADEGGSPEEVVDDRDKAARREKAPVFWRARDSLYFEPLVALAIIVVLLVSLFAYTSNWPPVYVVESNSMQHGSGDHIGDLNAGDIVLVQKASAGSIVTYVDALHSGFSTYGSLGDVVVYDPNGSSSATPIVHRAVIYLAYDASNQTWNGTGLTGLSCGVGSGHAYSVQGPGAPCDATYMTGSDALTLYDVGGRTVNIQFGPDSGELGGHSGFLTLGDNNSNPDQLPPTGSPPLSSLVEPAWVIGVARGMIPWFGALKLLLDGNAGKVPAASWEFLGLTIAGVIFAGAGLHILARRRKEEYLFSRGRRERAEEEEVPRSAGRPTMRPWRARAEPSDDDDAPPRPSTTRQSYEQRRRAHFTSSRERRVTRRPVKEPDASDESDSS